MNATFQVTRKELEAAMLFASQDDSRAVLNSVLVELRSGRFPMLVATDGKCMVAIECQQAGPSYEGDSIDYAIHASLLSELVSSMKSCRVDIATFEILCFENKPTWRRVQTSFTTKSGSVSSLSLEGDLLNYPRWRECMPRPDAKPGQPLVMCFNPAIMVKLNKLVSLLVSRKECRPGVTLWATDPLSPIQATCYGLSFWATVMPMRRDDQGRDLVTPSFLQDREPLPKKEEAGK